MPLYDYLCKYCQHADEVLESLNSEKIKPCPQCKQATFSRQVSAPRFELKGTGWYETDFKHKGKPPEKTSTDDKS